MVVRNAPNLDLISNFGEWDTETARKSVKKTPCIKRKEKHEREIDHGECKIDGIVWLKATKYF